MPRRSGFAGEAQTGERTTAKGGSDPWVGFNWRYDSGLVAGSVPDFATALSFDADQQAAIGLFCGNTFATLSAPLTGCAAWTPHGATRIQIPADGTENDDKNPPRVAPRHLFDLSVGDDTCSGATATSGACSLR